MKTRRIFLKGLGATVVATTALNTGCTDILNNQNSQEIPPEIEESLSEIENILRNKLKNYNNVVKSEKTDATALQRPEKNTYGINIVTELTQPYAESLEELYLTEDTTITVKQLNRAVEEPGYEMFETTLDKLHDFNSEIAEIKEYSFSFEGDKDCYTGQTMNRKKAERIYSSNKPKKEYIKTLKNMDQQPFIGCGNIHPS